MTEHTMETQFQLIRILGRIVERLIDREEGQDMLEYALLAALLSIAAIAIIMSFGGPLQNLFQNVVVTVSHASGSGGGIEAPTAVATP